MAAAAAASAQTSVPCCFHRGPSPTLAADCQRSRLLHYPLRSPRHVACFSSPVTPVTKMVPTAASLAATASASLGELARALVNLAGAVTEKMADGLSTPWMAVLAGTGRCLELYRQVLLVRCLLTWFPSVQWERQPFSAMRDLCDPFLRFFQRAAPPVFGNTLDVSSLLAVTALRILARLLIPSEPNGL